MNSTESTDQRFNRRQRLHELTVALLGQQRDLELMDVEGPSVSATSASDTVQDPARWLDRNKRVLNHYQALVRTAVTIDSLLDSEESVEI